MAMGRPRVPLISRDKVVDTGLRIVDEEGLEALTTRRLADELGVQSPSLYNHFKNKEEILQAVADRAYTQVPPRMRKGDPVELMTLGARHLRACIRAHPNLVPIMVRQRSTGLGSRMLNVVGERLVADGVPLPAVMPLFELLERFAIGTAMREISNPERHQLAAGEEKQYPLLADAIEAQAPLDDALFDATVRAMIRAIIDATAASAAAVGPAGASVAAR